MTAPPTTASHPAVPDPGAGPVAGRRAATPRRVARLDNEPARWRDLAVGIEVAAR